MYAGMSVDSIKFTINVSILSKMCYNLCYTTGMFTLIRDYERRATILNTARLRWDEYQWLQYNGTDITEQMLNFLLEYTFWISSLI
jgi:hypothetical protein